ncbi:hypothetical protein OHD16_19655 [Sphingobacterium sp. ML3W]|jgi:hypothetical protein|uniref:hypothetical protein n=1 Tax=Sphingobacterium sp. ML3W TaxID=1538644 RepID=UPI00249A9017|nr:hypothetical protein [Sphingobacterium sp. ML3W]WFA82175.1 hypothetical protein OGI71_12795 [Sphingobacterium sp. ML3W]
MKKDNTTLEMKKKQKYVSPVLEIGIIEMECGIAKGSAGVKPGPGIEEEWETDTEEETTVKWQ